MTSGIPSFEADEVALLVSAVQKILEHLREANERVGGNDTELTEYGADLIGKGGHVRTVPVPFWVKTGLDAWLVAAGISSGPVFRAINKSGRIAAKSFSPKVIWGLVKTAASASGLQRVAPHDLRRTCARLCHEAGGELEQIQFLLGHVSVQTTEC